jgi:hypothetical protein
MLLSINMNGDAAFLNLVKLLSGYSLIFTGLLYWAYNYKAAHLSELHDK